MPRSGADAAVAARFDEELRVLDADLLRPMISRPDATPASELPAELRSTTLERRRPRIVNELTPALDAAVRSALATDPLELMIVLKQVRRAIELAASAHERTAWWQRRDAGARHHESDVREVVWVNLIESTAFDLEDNTRDGEVQAAVTELHAQAADAELGAHGESASSAAKQGADRRGVRRARPFTESETEWRAEYVRWRRRPL